MLAPHARRPPALEPRPRRRVRLRALGDPQTSPDFELIARVATLPEIELERLDNVLYVGRPASGGGAQATVSLFRVEADGRTAVRVPVKLGRASVNTVEVVDGLREGDTVILSDTSQWDGVDKLRLD